MTFVVGRHKTQTQTNKTIYQNIPQSFYNAISRSEAESVGLKPCFIQTNMYSHI